MTSSRPIPNLRRRSERGYILITIILFVSLIAIAAVIMAPVIAFQVKRDREEELIHRGVQYSRAMKHFVKKFGRYPMGLEELENTNQVRFLRRRYKDPITGKDFKILHMGDVQMAFGAGIAGAVRWIVSDPWAGITLPVVLATTSVVNPASGPVTLVMWASTVPWFVIVKLAGVGAAPPQ